MATADSTKLTNGTTSNEASYHAGDASSTSSQEDFYKKSRLGKADVLNNLYKYDATQTENASNQEDSSFSGPGHTPANTHKKSSANNIQASASSNYIEIIRSYYTKMIAQALQKVQTHAGTSAASVYIDKILHAIRDYEDKSPDDPLLEFLLALYDALAVDGLWASYTGEQYKAAEQILIRLVNVSLTLANIAKAIAGLSQAGFNLLPYAYASESDDES